MKRWPLRWKIAIYAALLGIVATIAGACTTWTIMHYWELSAFDRRLTLDARELFRDIENFEGGWANNRRAFKEKFVPLALKDRFIDIEGVDKEVLFLSPNLAAPIADDGRPDIHTRRVGDYQVRMGTFHEDGLTAHIGANMREVNEIGWDIFRGMLGAIPTVVIVVVLGGRWVAKQALGPVDAIRQAAARITVQTLDQRLPVPPTGDEIAALIEVLNATFDRLERSFQQSMRFSADASHHLKTPLTVMRAEVESVLIDPGASRDEQERGEELLHQIHHLTSISEDLLLLARADAGRLEFQQEEFDLCEVLEGVIDDARALAEPDNLKVEAEMPERLLLLGDRRSISLIVQNLVENAVKYNQPGGSIRIQAANINGEVEVTVRNTGEPIPPDRAAHIFERFYRARPHGRPGSGLGLSIASELTKAQGGRLELVRSDAAGTEFRLRLKVA